MRQGFPMARAGMVIGLLGGSFDPAHEGHVHITREALKRIGIDRVWWLVSPGNPLKARQPAPMADRLAHARALICDPRVVVTDLEARLGTVYTADTIARLQAMAMVPVAVLARPGAGLKARLSVAAQVFAGNRVGRGENLARRKAPAWVFVNLPMNDASSTEIRNRGGWRA